VSCASATFCVAVTDGGDAATFDGSSWSAFKTIDPSAFTGNAQLGMDVSCPSTTFCAAVDVGNSAVAGGVVTYNGSSWSARASLGSNYDVTVSCTSSTFCVASDILGGETGGAQVFNGSTWSSASPIAAGVAAAAAIVSCGSPTLCVAVLGNGVVAVGK
jgi:hypothetical protein